MLALVLSIALVLARSPIEPCRVEGHTPGVLGPPVPLRPSSDPAYYNWLWRRGAA